MLSVAFTLLTCLVHAQSFTAGSTVDWSGAGLSEEPPVLVQEIDFLAFGGAGDGMTDDAVMLQDALDALGGMPGMVFLPAGVYRLGAPIEMPTGAVLRGAGADSTRLLFDLGGSTADAVRIASPVEDPPVALSQLPAFGGNRLVLVPGGGASFAPGDWVEMVQDNGSWDLSPAPWAEESAGFITRISAVSGDTLRLADNMPLALDAGYSPRIRRIEPIRFAGLECLALERVDSASKGSLVQCFLAADCWLHGVELYRSNGAHVLAARSSHLHISGCYVHESRQYDGVSTRGYGIALVRHTGHCLVEDNVFRRLRHAMIVKQGAVANVFTHNYSLEANRSELIADYSGDISLHGHFPTANLFEGNDVENIITDDYWGPAGPRNTFYRNRVRRYGILLTSAVTDAQNYAGNDVVGSGLLMGQFLLLGGGHNVTGNLVQGMLTPPGSALVGENSLFRMEAPGWWDAAAAWPNLGFGEAGVLPAQARFDAGSPAACRSARCSSPAGPVIGVASDASATASWRTVAGANAYEWRGRRQGEAWKYRMLQDTLLPLPNLASGSYTWQVRARCGDRIGIATPPFVHKVNTRQAAEHIPASETRQWRLWDMQGRLIQAGTLPVPERWRGLPFGMYILQKPSGTRPLVLRP